MSKSNQVSYHNLIQIDAYLQGLWGDNAFLFYPQTNPNVIGELLKRCTIPRQTQSLLKLYTLAGEGYEKGNRQVVPNV